MSGNPPSRGPAARGHDLDKIQNPEVARRFAGFAPPMRRRLLALRRLILETAAEQEAVTGVEETLKWGEPSYLSPVGSTIRIDRYQGSDRRYALFFNCNTRLVETFRELFPHELEFDANRAILLDCDAEPPIDALRQCITMALLYHRVKRLPLLGA